MPTRSPADVYEELFVPALFRQWGPFICEIAQVAPNERVLDVACGTGALAVAARERVGPHGAVAGLDASPEMLAVAARRHRDIVWHEGRAEALPFADATFDRVVSQFGLMFFTDPVAALREMTRVLRPGGRIGVAVWDALDRAPGYARLAALLDTACGPRIAEAFRAPFVLGDANALLDLCATAGLDGAQVSRRVGAVQFASIGALLAAEHACAWTLGGLLDAAAFTRLRREADGALNDLAAGDGSVRFPIAALVLTAQAR